jgi:hypothetical protein
MRIEMSDNFYLKDDEREIAEPIQLNEQESDIEVKRIETPHAEGPVRRSDGLLIHENDGSGETVKLDEFAFVGGLVTGEEEPDDKGKKKKFKKKKKSVNPAADGRRFKKKEEKVESRQQRKQEKEIRKAKKINEKLHRKEVEKLNRRLRPVSRKTFNSLGIVAFDTKAGTIRKNENHWIKTYKLEGLSSDNRNQFIDELTRFLSIRARITTNLNMAGSGKLVRTDFITFFVDGEDYESVKNQLGVEVKTLNSISNEVNIVPVSLNAFMNQVRRNFLYEGAEVDFENLTKKKADWKMDAFGDIVVKDDYFTSNEKMGACLQVIQFPSEINEELLSELLKINKPIMMVTDIQPIDDETNDDYKRVIERRYNTEIEAFENCFINVGFTVVVITENAELNNKVIDAVQGLFCDRNMVISPVYGNTADVLESSFSYGIRDYHSMRNIPVGQVKKLVL